MGTRVVGQEISGTFPARTQRSQIAGPVRLAGVVGAEYEEDRQAWRKRGTSASHSRFSSVQRIAAGGRSRPCCWPPKPLSNYGSTNR